MNINTTDKVQVGDSTAGTSTSTTWQCPYTRPKAEQGWECPRCGRINAPWVRQCDCSRSYDKWDITWNKDDYTKPWWYDYKVTCAPETTCDAPSSICGSDSTTRQNPHSTIYTTAQNPVVGGSCTNPNIAVNDFTTYRTDVPKTYTTIKTPKETK